MIAVDSNVLIYAHCHFISRFVAFSNDGCAVVVLDRYFPKA